MNTIIASTPAKARMIDIDEPIPTQPAVRARITERIPTVATDDRFLLVGAFSFEGMEEHVSIMSYQGKNLMDLHTLTKSDARRLMEALAQLV